jgi:hypothetical protein
MPSGWDAASITFQASSDCTNFFNLFNDSGNEVTVTGPAASEYILIASPVQFLGVGPCIKVRSGTNAAPVNQTANRTITLVAVP